MRPKRKFPIISKEMKSKRKFATIKEQKAVAVLEAVSAEVIGKFERSKDIYYDPNTKGGNYEKIVSSFFESYFGGVLDFHERAQILDADLAYMEVFARGGNNFDVVATYKTAVPKLAFTIEQTAFVPLDSVAFVVEVKQDISRSFLEDDLKKLEKFGKLKVTEDRMALTVGSEFEVKKPLRILLYYSGSIDEGELEALLNNYEQHWDILIILQNDQIWASPCLPWTKHIFKTPRMYYCPLHALYQGIILISTSLPAPIRVDTERLFYNLLMIGEP